MNTEDTENHRLWVEVGYLSYMISMLKRNSQPMKHMREQSQSRMYNLTGCEIDGKGARRIGGKVSRLTKEFGLGVIMCFPPRLTSTMLERIARWADITAEAWPHERSRKQQFQSGM